jgi:hypothetical protein
MKIKFIEGDIVWGKMNGIVLWESFNMGKGTNEKVMNAGRYTYNNKTMTIVKQKYWYVFLFVLLHEFTHGIIDCIFPHKEENKFGFNLEGGEIQYIYLKQPLRKVHFLHNILDKLWKIPKSWKGGK